MLSITRINRLGHRGMTLVEVVFIGSLSALLTLMAFVIFRSHQAALSQSTQELRSQQITANLAAEIKSEVHSKRWVIPPDSLISCRIPGSIGVVSSSFAVFTNSERPECLRGTYPPNWIGYGVNVSGELVKAPTPTTWNDLLTYTSWPPLLISGHKVFVTNPIPFVFRHESGELTINFQSVKFDSATAESVWMAPILTRGFFGSL